MATSQVNLLDYVNAARRRLPIALGIIAVMVVAATVYAYSLPDIYRASAEFRIDLEGPAHDRLQPVVLTNYADQYIGSLRQKVLSRDNVAGWITELRIHPNDEADQSVGQLIARVRGDTRVDMITTSVLQPGSVRNVSLITGFRVSFDSLDPATSERVARRLAEEFLKEDHLTRTQRAATTSGFLREQIQAKHDEIVELEGRLAAFKEENAGALPDTMNLNMSVIDRIERDLEVIQAEIRNLEQERVFRMAQLDQIVQRSASATQLAELERDYRRMVSVYGPDHPDLIRVRRQIDSLTAGALPGSGDPEIAGLETELAAARQRYSDEHPDVLSLMRRLEARRAEQQSEDGRSGISEGDNDPVYLQLRAQVQTIDIRLASLNTRTRDLRTRLAETEARLIRTPQVEREYQALMRDLSSARDVFRNLQDRLAVARQTEALESGEHGARITLIQQPYLPEHPAAPQRSSIISMALMFGVALSAVIAILAEAIDTKVRGSRDIYNAFESPPLAIIPDVQNSLSRAHSRRRLLLYGGGLLFLAAAVAMMIGLPG